MLKHIVMLRLPKAYTETDKKTAIAELKTALEALPQQIEEIAFYRVGINLSQSQSAFDMVLDSEFANTQALNLYRIHPEHKKVLGIIAKHNCEIAVVDYEF